MKNSHNINMYIIAKLNSNFDFNLNLSWVLYYFRFVRPPNHHPPPTHPPPTRTSSWTPTSDAILTPYLDYNLIYTLQLNSSINLISNLNVT